MYVYNSLRALAIAFGWVRREFYNRGNAIKTIFLIGQHLSGWMFAVSDFFGDVEDRAYDLAGDWNAFYNWVIDNLGVSNVPALLLSYADDLIEFIRYPQRWIIDILKVYLPALWDILDDPISFVLEIIYRYTGLSLEFIDNPRRIVMDWIREVVGDVREIAQDPIGWIQDRLSEIIPDFWEFVYNARGWVRRQIEDEFPFLMSFLSDPDGFVLNKLEDFLDDLGDRYQEKVIRLAEKILNTIF
jgi:hypothetical protein